MSNFERLLRNIGRHDLIDIEHVSLPRKLRLSVLLSRSEQRDKNTLFHQMSSGSNLTPEEAATAVCEGLEWGLGEYSE